MKITIYTVCVLVDSYADNITDTWADSFIDWESALDYIDGQKIYLRDEYFGKLEEGKDYKLTDTEDHRKVSLIDLYDSRYCHITTTEKTIEL